MPCIIYQFNLPTSVDSLLAPSMDITWVQLRAHVGHTVCRGASADAITGGKEAGTVFEPRWHSSIRVVDKGEIHFDTVGTCKQAVARKQPNMHTHELTTETRQGTARDG